MPLLMCKLEGYFKINIWFSLYRSLAGILHSMDIDLEITLKGGNADITLKGGTAVYYFPF